MLNLKSVLGGGVFRNEPVREKTNSLGFDQVQQNPGCTVTEVGSSDLESRGIVLSV